ncbi:MAG: GntP family permease [Vagococcus fluvialis]
MDIFIILLALGLLMYTAYKGHSVIIFAPLCALLAVAFIAPSQILPFYSNIFMVKMVEFVKNYFPVFLLGAIFGKLVEMSGVAESIANTIIKVIGEKRTILSIVLLCAILTYSGVSLFVVSFAVYPFAKKLFMVADIPKRLIPATITLGAISFTMDALPGTPQIQNVIPTSYFGTTLYAAPILGTIGSIYVLIVGMFYLQRQAKRYMDKGEGYFDSEKSETEKENFNMGDSQLVEESLARKIFAFLPLVLVGVSNKFFTTYIPKWYPNGFDFADIGLEQFGVIEIQSVLGIWSVVLALLLGIIATIIYNPSIIKDIKDGVNSSIGGALLASMNTGSEYGFGGIIAALPGFMIIQNGLGNAFSNPLANAAVSTNVLAGITGSASGGMSIALSAMGDRFIEMANAANIPLPVVHRVVSMASGGMDTLPHNGAIITLLSVTGLSHKQAYKDIFGITLLKTTGVIVVIGVYYLTGWV